MNAKPFHLQYFAHLMLLKVYIVPAMVLQLESLYYAIFLIWNVCSIFLI